MCTSERTPTLRITPAGVVTVGLMTVAIFLAATALVRAARRLGGRHHQRLLLLPAGQGLTAR